MDNWCLNCSVELSPKEAHSAYCKRCRKQMDAEEEYFNRTQQSALQESRCEGSSSETATSTSDYESTVLTTPSEESDYPDSASTNLSNYPLFHRNSPKTVTQALSNRQVNHLIPPLPSAPIFSTRTSGYRLSSHMSATVPAYTSAYRNKPVVSSNAAIPTAPSPDGHRSPESPSTRRHSRKGPKLSLTRNSHSSSSVPSLRRPPKPLQRGFFLANEDENDSDADDDLVTHMPSSSSRLRRIDSGGQRTPVGKRSRSAIWSMAELSLIDGQADDESELEQDLEEEEGRGRSRMISRTISNS